MFQNKKGFLKISLQIDFQFCHWGSPVLDLLHLLYTSLREELYDQRHIESYAPIYYYELKKVLQKLNYDLNSFPTLHQFQLEFVKKMFYGKSAATKKEDNFKGIY